MADYDFRDAGEVVIEERHEYKKQLSRDASSLISKLEAFKGTFDTVYASSTESQKANLDTAFLNFKRDAKTALGL